MPDGKPDAPAGHVVRLRQRVEFDPHVLCAIDFHEARRGLAVVENLRIGCVVADDDLVLLGKIHHLLKVVLAHDDRCRVVRRIQEHQLCFFRHILGNCLQVWQEAVLLRERHEVRDASGEAGTDGIDRVTGARDQHDVPRIDKCERNMPDAFLRADQRENFVRRVESDVEPPLVPIGDGLSERQHAFIRWILVVFWIFRGLAEAFDDRCRGRQVGVADAKIDDIDALGNRGLLHHINRGKQIGRQGLDSCGNFDGETRHASRLLS